MFVLNRALFAITQFQQKNKDPFFYLFITAQGRRTLHVIFMIFLVY